MSLDGAPPDETISGLDWERPSESRLLAGRVWGTIISVLGGTVTWLWGSIILPRFLLPYSVPFGIILIVGSYTGIIGGIASWGSTSAMNKYFAENFQKDPVKALAYVRYTYRFKTIISLTTGLSLLSIGLFVFPFLPIKWPFAYGILIVITSIQWLTGRYDIYNQLVYARQRFDYQNLIAFFTTMASIGATATGLWVMNLLLPGDPITAGVIALGLGTLTQTVFGLVLSYKAIGKMGIFQNHPLSTLTYSREVSHHMFRYGSFIMGQGILSTLTAVGGIIWVLILQIVIPQSESAIGFWKIGFDYTGVLGYMSILSAPLFPAISEAHGTHNNTLRDRYIAMSLKWGFYLGVPFLLAYSCIAYDLILGFTGPVWADSVPILAIGIFGVFFGKLGEYLIAIANGVGLEHLPFYYHLIQLPVMVVTMFLFASIFGIVGAAIALVCQQLTGVIVLFVILRRNLAFHVPSWIAWQPSVVGAILVIPLGVFVLPWLNSFTDLWIAAIAFIGLFLGLYYLIAAFFGGLAPADIAIAKDMFKGNTLVINLLNFVEKVASKGPFYGKFNY